MGYKIKEVREARKMTQEELAEKSDHKDVVQTRQGSRHQCGPDFFCRECLTD